MNRYKIAGLLAAAALLAGGTAAPVLAATNDSYKIPGCYHDTSGPGLKNWHGRSSQDGWSKWFYSKSGCTAAAVEHWGKVTGD